MEPPSLPSVHNVGDMPLQQRAERVARMRKDRDWKRAPASAVARASPNANDSEVAQWYALGGRTRVVFDPNVPILGSSMIQTVQGPQENLPRPSAFPTPQVPNQASDALSDDSVSVVEAPPGPSCLPSRDSEYRKTNIYHTAYRLERENQSLKGQLTQQEIQIDGLRRQLSESQALQKKAEQEISNLRKRSDTRTPPTDELIAQNLRRIFSGNSTVSQDEVSPNNDNASAAINELERMLALARSNRTQVEEGRLQAVDESLFARQYDLLREENNYMLPPRDQLQPHPTELGSQRTRIGSIPEGQADKLRECERRLAELTTQLEWCEANRKKMQREWDERLAMEMKWRDDLLAIIKYNDMYRVERGRKDPAALVPIQQPAQGAQGDSAGAQQDVACLTTATTSSGTFGIFTSSMSPLPGGFISHPPRV